MSIDAKYQTFGARFLAWIIDTLVVVPFVLLDFLFFQPARPILLVAAWAIVSYFSYSVYSVLMHARFGQTLGKMATGVIVLDQTETSVPGLRRALWRDSVYIFALLISVSWFLVLLFRDGFEKAYYNSDVALPIMYAMMGWVLLELWTMLSNRRRRALHDFIGDTVVVKTSCLKNAEPGDAPSGGPATLLVNSSLTEGPPSVS